MKTANLLALKKIPAMWYTFYAILENLLSIT